MRDGNEDATRVHHRFMRRALDLAGAVQHTSPNPKVGAVIVRDDEIVGEGRHEGAGTPHAEALALVAAGDAAGGATLYVNLEPCNHYGRMPPCAPAVAAAGIANVVVAIEDPDPRVQGHGLGFLRAHGIEVTLGVLAADAAALNAPFLHQRVTGRPLVRLKLALSIDGRLAAPDGSARWITGPAARARGHAARAAADAVMVGAGCVVTDDPELSARDVGARRQPFRVVVDGSGRVEPDARVFSGPGGEVIMATTSAAPHDRHTAWKEAGAEILVLDRDGGGVDLQQLLGVLGERGFLEVLCEGGGELATSLLRSDLVELLEIHRGAVTLGRGGAEIADLGAASIEVAARWQLLTIERAGDDVISIYRRRRTQH